MKQQFRTKILTTKKFTLHLFFVLYLTLKVCSSKLFLQFYIEMGINGQVYPYDDIKQGVKVF